MTHSLRNETAAGVLIGAVGWDHDAWEGAYYPPDLPRDWRLAYYANEHGSVLVPARAWTAAGPEGWERWADDVAPGFRFLLELPRPAGGIGMGLDRLEACARVLGERLGGVLAPDPVDPAAARRLADAAALCRLMLRYSAPSELEEDLRRLADQGALGRWALPVDPPGAAGLDVALLAPEVVDDLRAARAVLEALEAGAGAGTSSAVLMGSPPDPARLEQLRTLAGLMGLA
ncbi:MAG: hypothetical protein PVG98_02205 [Chromatiales bacterium]|jgi:hypothetical protein